MRRGTILDGRPLATALLYVMIGILPLYLTSAQVLSLDADLGFGVAQLGMASALHFGIAALAAHPVGSLIQRRNATFGLRTGAGLAALAGLVAASAGRWWEILAVTALGGLANAFMQVATNVVLAQDAAYHRQGLSFGAKQGAVPLAGAMAGVLLPSVGVALGWRWPFAVAAAAAAAGMVAAPEVRNAPTVVVRAGRGRLSPALAWMAVGGMFGGAAGNSLSLFVVPSAVEAGLSQAAAGLFLAASSVLVFGTRLGAGWFADRQHSTGHREMITLLSFGAGACIALAAAGTAATYTIAMPLAMMGAWGWPGLIYFTVVRIHPEATARASGIILAGNLTGTLVGPVVVGLLASRSLYSQAWTMVALLSAAAAAAMVASQRSLSRAGAGPVPEPVRSEG